MREKTNASETGLITDLPRRPREEILTKGRLHRRPPPNLPLVRGRDWSRQPHSVAYAD